MDEFPRSIRFRMKGETFTDPFASFPPPPPLPSPPVSSSVFDRRGMVKRESQRQKRFPIFRSTERNLPAD